MDFRLDLETARLDVEKLQADLRESAEQGLALLDAKSLLQEENQLLELQLDEIRIERDALREALSKSSHDRKEAAHLDMEVEKDLLEEKMQAEENFTSRILVLEAENRNMKTQSERSLQETGKLRESVKAVSEDNEQLKRSHEKIHKELQEHRQTEKVMATENEDLHSDNVHLRKHVALLEFRTKEFEGLKFESRKLLEEKELLQCELEESRRLMEIVKQQSEEAWKTLENERELRRTIQRQFHDQTDERDRWNRMASLRLEVEEDAQFDNPAFAIDASGESNSLFDELKQTSNVNHTDFSDELNQCKERLEQILKISVALELLGASEFSFVEIQGQISSAAAEIRGLCSSTAGNADRSVFLDEMQSQLSKRSNRQAVLETKVNILTGIVEATCELLVEKQLSLNSCHDSLRSLRASFSTASSPSSGGNEPSGPSQDGSCSPSQASPKRFGKLEEEIRARINNADFKIPEIVNIDVAADSEMLMIAFDDLKHHCQDMLGSTPNRLKDTGEETMAELHERLKAHLGRKRDEANLLKEALTNTQMAAEKTMATLKAKYECEKDGSGRSLLQLRKELNQRKEDAATFASIRSMLNARCDDYCTQLETLQRQLRSAEEEKRTLNSLLRMAIQQKLNLIHRVEDLECALDGQQTQMRRREPIRRNPNLFRFRGRAPDQRSYGPR